MKSLSAQNAKKFVNAKEYALISASYKVSQGTNSVVLVKRRIQMARNFRNKYQQALNGKAASKPKLNRTLRVKVRLFEQALNRFIDQLDTFSTSARRSSKTASSARSSKSSLKSANAPQRSQQLSKKSSRSGRLTSQMASAANKTAKLKQHKNKRMVARQRGIAGAVRANTYRKQAKRDSR